MDAILLHICFSMNGPDYIVSDSFQPYNFYYSTLQFCAVPFFAKASGTVGSRILVCLDPSFDPMQ